MSPLFSSLLVLSLISPSFSYNRQAAEQELRFLSENARTYLTEILIWVAVVSVLIFAMVLCICDHAIRLLFNSCRREPSPVDIRCLREKSVDVEAASRPISTIIVPEGEEYADEYIFMGRRSVLV